VESPLASTPPGMPGTHPLQYFDLGDVNGKISHNIITYFNFSTPQYTKICHFDITNKKISGGGGIPSIGVEAQSTLGEAQKFCPKKICIKNQQNARILHDMPEFYMIFARKMPEFYIIIARKIFFPNFRGHPPRLLRL